MRMAKIALELTPEELEQYHPERHRPPTCPPKYARAWEQARQAARVLRERFGATRGVVYGSLAHKWYSEHSDSAIAVWGIAPKEFYRAAAVASDVIRDNVSLVFERIQSERLTFADFLEQRARDTEE